MNEKDFARQLELQKMAIEAKIEHEKRMNEIQERYSAGVEMLAKALRAEKSEENYRYQLEVGEIAKEQQEIRFRREQEKKEKNNQK